MTALHGGTLAAALARYPHAPRPLIDLSTGINPVPYPVGDPAPGEFTRLPEPGAIMALEAVAATAYGVIDPAMVVAAPGTQLLISLLPRILPQPAMAVLGPTYAEHAAAWRAGGAHVTAVATLAEALTEAAAVLCNPNNPDGRRIDPATLLAALATAPTRLLVVDEAFADLEPGMSVAPLLPQSTRTVVVLRSFGKTYGLAGVRLGFAVAPPAVAAAIRTALGPWAISGTAVRLGTRALADRDWRQAAGLRLDRDGARLDALLARAGCRALGGTRLFRLVAAPDGLAERLAHRGIVVRHFPERPEVLRFGLPGPADWDRVERGLLDAA